MAYTCDFHPDSNGEYEDPIKGLPTVCQECTTIACEVCAPKEMFIERQDDQIYYYLCLECVKFRRLRA